MAGQKFCMRMDFKPTGYKEIFALTAKSGGNIEMYYVYPGQTDLQKPLKAGDEFVNSSSMMVRYL
jgi:hypothetical protein